jgi:hypothetical protein
MPWQVRRKHNIPRAHKAVSHRQPGAMVVRRTVQQHDGAGRRSAREGRRFGVFGMNGTAIDQALHDKTPLRQSG